MLQNIDTDGTIKRKLSGGWKWMVIKSEEFIDEAVKQWVHVFELAFQHTEDILNIAFRHVYTHVYTSTVTCS